MAENESKRNVKRIENRTDVNAVYLKTKCALALLMSPVTSEYIEDELFFSELVHKYQLSNENT